MRLDHPTFPLAIKFLSLLPLDIDDKERQNLRQVLCRTFSITEDELLHAINKPQGVEQAANGNGNGHSPSDSDYGAADERELSDLLPHTGFLRSYIDYTIRSEAPLSYHVFNALTAVGAVLRRNVWYDMGYYQLYPPLAVVLLGPSGIAKTTSANIMFQMLIETELVVPYAEKITHEALAMQFSKHAQGLLYVPELTVLLSRQKYMEGVIEFLTRALDHPKFWVTETKGGGRIIMNDVAPTFLGCSTPDWFVASTPEATFGGGFMARLLLVAQECSPRVCYRPIIPPGDLKRELQGEFNDIHQFIGAVEFEPAADTFHKEWYEASKQKWRHPEIELLETYYQRKADHAKRVAMIIHIAQCRNMTVCLRCFQTAINLLDWNEKFLAPMFKKMFRTGVGVDADFVIKTIRAHGSLIDHSFLLRAVQHRMNASQLRGVLASLREAGLVEERIDKLQHTYVLTGRASE